MIERDLFDWVVLVRRSGRIGTQGRGRMDPHGSEGEDWKPPIPGMFFFTRSPPWPA